MNCCRRSGRLAAMNSDLDSEYSKQKIKTVGLAHFYESTLWLLGLFVFAAGCELKWQKITPRCQILYSVNRVVTSWPLFNQICWFGCALFESQNFRSSRCGDAEFLPDAAGADGAFDAFTSFDGFTQSLGSLIANTITAIANRAIATEWIGDWRDWFMLACSCHFDWNILEQWWSFDQWEQALSSNWFDRITADWCKNEVISFKLHCLKGLCNYWNAA